MKTFDRVFQNILVGTMEQSGLHGWVGGFIRVGQLFPKGVD